MVWNDSVLNEQNIQQPHCFPPKQSRRTITCSHNGLKNSMSFGPVCLFDPHLQSLPSSPSAQLHSLVPCCASNTPCICFKICVPCSSGWEPRPSSRSPHSSGLHYPLSMNTHTHTHLCTRTRAHVSTSQQPHVLHLITACLLIQVLQVKVDSWLATRPETH